MRVETDNGILFVGEKEEGISGQNQTATDVENNSWWARNPNSFRGTLVTPDRIQIDLKSYFHVGREIDVDRYGTYAVEKLEDGILYLVPVNEVYKDRRLKKLLYDLLPSKEELLEVLNNAPD